VISAPPPAIDSARVLAYAILDDSVQWTGRQKLTHDGKEVGPVPCLALCQNAWGDWEQIHIFHCNGDWEVLGAGGAPTIEEAKASAERSYRGISPKWVFVNTPREQAREWIRKESADALCSFCDRIPAEMDKLISGKSATICNHCAAKYHALMGRDAKGTDAV
jgi:hypothetical protein